MDLNEELELMADAGLLIRYGKTKLGDIQYGFSPLGARINAKVQRGEKLTDEEKDHLLKAGVSEEELRRTLGP